MSKYAIGGSQGRYQPGSNDTVLENSLGITESADMDEAELVLLEKLYRDVLFDHFPQGKITVPRSHAPAWECISLSQQNTPHTEP